jgi:hypothetical protein
VRASEWFGITACSAGSYCASGLFVNSNFENALETQIQRDA